MILWIFLSVAVLFFVLLGIKTLAGSKKLCVICASVVLTWVGLLVLYWRGSQVDKTLLALLIGESTLGIFYLVESKVREELKVFRLPFLLTLILLAYTLIEGRSYSLGVIYFTALLWVLFFVFYAYGNSGKLGSFTRKIVECCRDW